MFHSSAPWSQQHQNSSCQVVKLNSEPPMSLGQDELRSISTSAGFRASCCAASHPQYEQGRKDLPMSSETFEFKSSRSVMLKQDMHTVSYAVKKILRIRHVSCVFSEAYSDALHTQARRTCSPDTHD